MVETEAAADAAANEIKACFDAQGKTWDKTSDLVDAMIVAGPKSIPMGLAYENDFIAARRNQQNADNGLRLMYLDPTLTSANIMVTRTEGGRKLGDEFNQNPKLRKLLLESGYRTDRITPGDFRDLISKNHGITVSAELYTVGEPKADLLDRMIDAIKR